MTHTDVVDRLASHATLGSAPRAELEWLATRTFLQKLQEGDVVTRKGSVVENLYIVLSGHLAIFVDRGNGPTQVAEWHGGDVTGILPYSRMQSAPGDTVILAPTEFLALPRDLVPLLPHDCPRVTELLVHRMVDRARLFTTSNQHDEKMKSLGRLSAGLAHELNNPAAAIERSAALLEDRLDAAERATLELGAARLGPDQFAAVQAIRAACLAPKVQGVLSPIEQAEREDALTDWLDDHDLPSDIAGVLVETSVTVEALGQLAAAVDRPVLGAALRWAANGCAVRTLASEIQDASTRISGLVAAIKGFTHMDQGDSAEPLDLAQNLSNTVTVLRAKARGKSAAVALDIPEGLPPVCGFVGELNQVWSNLIDNALDAVADSDGRVEIAARADRGRVLVTVTDNGGGIPLDAQSRIFDPFFTTKPVGQGTGLGLDIVRRVLEHNKATITLQSQPGRTCFTVSLPTATPKGPAGVPA